MAETIPAEDHSKTGTGNVRERPRTPGSGKASETRDEETDFPFWADRRRGGGEGESRCCSTWKSGKASEASVASRPKKSTQLLINYTIPG